MAEKDKYRFNVKGLDKAKRLDRVLREKIEGISRKAVQKAISSRKVRVNNKLVWLASWQLNNGDQIEISDFEDPMAKERPKFKKAWILKDIGDIIGVNKPAGLLSHRTRFTKDNDISALMNEKFGDLDLFHRLDRDTSGVMLFTRGGKINSYLDRVFKENLAEKLYFAVVEEVSGVASSGVIRDRIAQNPKRRDKSTIVSKGGKSAVTKWEVVGIDDGKMLLAVHIETGRMHQIRLHLSHIGMPILGDRLYGNKSEETKRLMLHSAKITLPEMDGFSQSHFFAHAPKDFLEELSPALQESCKAYKP